MKSYLAPISAFILFSVLAVPAAFSAPPQEPLTVIVEGDGTVTSDRGNISCPSVCDESYKKNSTVVLTATADHNSSFLGWNGNGDCAGTQLTCELKMDAPKNVTARFDTAAVTFPAPVLQTGQTLCVGQPGPIDCAGTGQDGDLQAGVPLPRPRFTDNGDGTVTDNASGLRWLKDVGCLGNPTFNDSFDVVASLNADTDLSCTDYLAGTFNDWRVANIRELLSLIDYAYYSPPISNTQGDEHWSEGDPFVNVQVSVDGAPALIRSSTTVSQGAPNSASIFALRIPAGAPVQVIGPASTPTIFIWAVRGPE
jgi:hypothetical protein